MTDDYLPPTKTQLDYEVGADLVKDDASWKQNRNVTIPNVLDENGNMMRVNNNIIDDENKCVIH